MELTALNLAEAKAGLVAGNFTAAELVQAYTSRIGKLDDKLGTFLHLATESVLRQAQDDVGTGALVGIPFAHKDLICTPDMPTTAASKILENYQPTHAATVHERLADAGAVCLGKLNLDEFALGSSTENSAYKTTKNPWDTSRVPGGTSGGSAAAVAADLCVFATGTDTGGSIRQPASFCGVTGLKVTYGRVSRYGVVAAASSLDTVGFLTKTVRDAAELLGIAAGKDPRDATTGDQPVPNYTAELRTDLKGLKVGVPKEYFIDGLNPEVEAAIRAGIEKMRELGAEIVEVSLPHTDAALAAYYIINPSEVSTNMARYDGIRFGSAGQGEDLVETYFDARTKGFGDEVKRRIMLGTFALSAGYADQFYKKAIQARTLVKQDFDNVFEEVDVLATPVAPTTAFKIGEKSNDPIEMYLADIFTIPASLAGVPGISVPAGFDSTGLPIGMQLLAGQWEEAKLLGAAHAFQMATDHHTKKPTL